jgi:hypothetical protein
LIIYKYPIEFKPEQTIDGFAKMRFIYSNYQRGVMTLWAEVDETTEKIPRTVYVVPTGRVLTHRQHNYVGTFMQGDYVWHIYVH